MISFVFRNNPYKHPVLLEITKGKSFEKVSFFGVAFYKCLSDKSSLVCIDDPLVIFYLFFSHKLRKLKVVFYSLELYERQVFCNSLYKCLRNFLFYISNFLAQKRASSIIFPSKLRQQYFNKRKNIINKSHIIYNKPDFNEVEVSEICEESKNWIDTERKKGRKIIVFAGGLQEGRDIDLIIDSLTINSSYSLVLAGPVTGLNLEMKIKNSPDVLYLGNLSRGKVFSLYSECDYGLLNYSNDLKNSELCAPIKMWEYQHFDLKIIANRNKAILEEWAPIIDAFYEGNNINKTIDNEYKSDFFKDVLSMRKAFNKHIETLA